MVSKNTVIDSALCRRLGEAYWFGMVLSSNDFLRFPRERFFDICEEFWTVVDG